MDLLLLGQPSMTLVLRPFYPGAFTSLHSEWFDRGWWSLREVTSLAQEVPVSAQYAVGVTQICPEAFAYISSAQLCCDPKLEGTQS